MKTILLKLDEFYGVKCCRRTLYRDMKWLEGNGFIGRQCRHFRKPSGELKLRSTLYWLKRNAYRFFESLAYWVKKHVRGFAVTKMSLDKLPYSRVSRVLGVSNVIRGAFNPFKQRLKPSEAIL